MNPFQSDIPAFQFAQWNLDRLNSPSGLELACIEIGDVLGQRSPNFDPVDFLDWLACRVRSRQRGHDPVGLLAHLHDVLFDEEKFQGNLESFYVIENQLMHSVLARRQGMPVMLSLIYKRIADRLGLCVQGLNTPGHFLVRVRDRHGWLIVDPFCRGRAMTEREAIERLAHATGWNTDSIAAQFRPIEPVDWLYRCLLSLQNGLKRTGETERSDLIQSALQHVSKLSNEA